MKTSCALFLLILSFGSARSQSFEMGTNGKDTINYINYKGYKVGPWIIRGKHIPKSGYTSEQKIEVGSYVNNRKDGVWVEFYKNGKMRSKLTYVNGTLNGAATFYDQTEKVLKEGAFKDNKWVSGQ